MRLSRQGSATSRSAGFIFAALALLVACASLALRSGSLSNGSDRASHSTKSGKLPSSVAAGTTSVLESYAQLPLAFEPNHGQTDPKVKFLSRSRDFDLFLTSDSAVLSLQPSAGNGRDAGASVFSMRFVNASSHPQFQGAAQLPGKSNYFIGKDPSKWRRDIPQFARVRYANVYPGIDVVFYGNRGRLEYDFEVSPGSDVHRMALKFEGAKKLAFDAGGDLVLTLSQGDVRLQAPNIYQLIGEQRAPVRGRFELRRNTEVGFVVGDYDRNRKLIIDPVLSYSTYLGGSGTEGCSVILGTGTPVSGCPAVAVDPASNAYLAGSTTSADFPLTTGPYQAGLRGTANVFITKFNSAANTLLFSTYIGGTGRDYTAGVGIDSATDVFVAGTTTSANFPTTTGTAFQGGRTNANQHVFVSKLGPSGNALLYSTYLSGNGTDIATGLAVGQSDQNAYVTGTTTSTNTPSSGSSFPATLGSYQPAPATGSTVQFFMSKINPNLSQQSSLAYSTYFGGGNPSTGVAVGGGIAVDVSNNVYITGGTNFLRVGAPNDFPILNAYQACLDAPPATTSCAASATATDAFVAEFNPNATTTGSQLLYSTYIGGSGNDVGYGIATDGTSAYVTGSTSSTDFPIAGSGVFQATNGGGSSDAFLVKLANPVTTGTTPGLVTLSYFTYIGGANTDVGLAVAVDTIQGARVTGWTNSTNLPVLNNDIQSGLAAACPSPTTCLSNAFVARIDTTATSPTAAGHYLTYLGGSGPDYGTGIAVDPAGASYVAGQTSSPNFLLSAPPQTPAFQPNLNGGTDAFLSKFGPALSLTLTGNSSPPIVGVGNQVSFEYTISNTGDPASNIIFTDSLPSSGASFTSATVSSGTCGTATAAIVSCTIGNLNAGATATATVVLTPIASTTPATTTLSLGNTASVTVQGCATCTQSLTTSAFVNDFNISVSPSTATAPAGVPATYTATITPTHSASANGFPESVSFSCSSGLPTGASCTETTNPIPNLNNGPVSTVLVISTTARVTTTTELRNSRAPFYVVWLPVSGLALLGMGIGGPRRRHWLVGLFFAGLFSLILFQAGCSTKAAVTTTSGTPAGTYLVTVTATSGSATRNATVTLVVQ